MLGVFEPQHRPLVAGHVGLLADLVNIVEDRGRLPVDVGRGTVAIGRGDMVGDRRRAMAERYFVSLGKLRAHALAGGRFQVNGEGDFSDEAALTMAAAHALDGFCPDWRQRVRAGESVFELQVPEVWNALHHLVDFPLHVKTRSKPRVARARGQRGAPLARKTGRPKLRVI
jgi:hypothetical protein